MKMHALNGDGMDGGLGLAQQLEGAHGALFDGGGKRGGADDFQNCRQGPMSSVRVRMSMRVVFMRGVRGVRVSPLFRRRKRKGWGT